MKKSEKFLKISSEKRIKMSIKKIVEINNPFNSK
jgi:hypothetical protein